MITLDTTIKYLALVLGGAETTNHLPFVSCYADCSPTQFNPGEQDGTSNGTSPVIILASPNNGYERQLKYFSLHNADTAAAAITLSMVNGSNSRTLLSFTLNVGFMLTYNLGSGWTVIDNYGNHITSGTSGFSGTSGYSGGAGGAGASGTSGYSGGAGASGTSGYSGAGTSGFSGSDGTSGYSGVSGSGGGSTPPVNSTMTVSAGAATIDGFSEYTSNLTCTSDSTAWTATYNNILDGETVEIDYYKTTASNTVITFPSGTVVSASCDGFVSGLTLTLFSTTSGEFGITILRQGSVYKVYCAQDVG